MYNRIRYTDNNISTPTYVLANERILPRRVRYIVLLAFSTILIGLSTNILFSQSSSPAQWLTPRGSIDALRTQRFPSTRQIIDSLTIVWSTPLIAGDIAPLIGNIVPNQKLSADYPFAPNELIAVVGGKLVIIDATGRPLRSTQLPPFIRAASLILDTTALPPIVQGLYPSLIAFETIENTNTRDSSIYSLIAGWDFNNDTLAVIKRIALDTREYAPNFFGSLRPVAARPLGADIVLYTMVDMTSPILAPPFPATPFFRGMTLFQLGNLTPPFPQLDVADTVSERITVGPRIGFTQPSITRLINGNTALALPAYHSSLDFPITNSLRPSLPTFSNRPLMMAVELRANQYAESIAPIDLESVFANVARPRTIPYYLTLRDAGVGNAVRQVILLSEEFRGRDSSFGQARLHLFETNGDPITGVNDPLSPVFLGKQNHGWSISTGNIDGNDTNRFLPFFPNNPGDEIVVTHTTPEIAIPGSNLMILRYKSGSPLQKPAPRNSFLNPLDTICSMQINGWVAAVADIDNDDDGKAEICIADGNDFYILRMRNYSDSRFRRGTPFDTVYHTYFRNENINHVSLADVDGNGTTDILITTNIRTYFIGQVIGSSLKILSPSRTAPTTTITNFCVGDSIKITWANIFRGQATLRLRLRQYYSSSPFALSSDTGRVLRASYLNDADTVSFSVLADTSLRNTYARVIIENAQTNVILDSSAIFSLLPPKLQIDQRTRNTPIHSLGSAILTGSIQCIDSLRVSFSIDSGRTWQSVLSATTFRNDTSFSLTVPVPCPSIFGCDTDKDSTIRLRIVGSSSLEKGKLYSDSAKIPVKPAKIPIRIYPEPSLLCKERDIAWTFPPQLLADTAHNDTVIVSISADNGRTFLPVSIQSSTDNTYRYNPPTNALDSIILRICVPNTCFRIDTTLYNARATLIHSVAPNPFIAGTEICEIFSSPSTTSTVLVRIYDQNNRIVSELVRNEQRQANIVYCDRWNGQNDEGKIVGAGMYYAVIESSDGSKEFYPIYVKK